MFDSKSDLARLFCSFLPQCTSIPALYLHCISNSQFRKHSSLRRCSAALVSADDVDKKVNCLGEVVLRHYSEDALFALLRIPNVFRCLVNMGGPGCPVSPKFKIHCSYFVRKHFISAQRRVSYPGGGLLRHCSVSAQFCPEYHAQVVPLFECCQMISQHVQTRVHTGMDAGSVFLKVVPFSTKKTAAYAPRLCDF